MFYATKIKSIGNGVAVDVQGRSLRFIGYLPVKAGDTVYTDGNIIFGHVPPKSAPVIFDEPSGIPVLGTSGDNEELRGYFTSRGKYKKYRIKGDNWIVNDKKIYAHDTDDTDIIDAEISADGALYTVEKTVADLEDDDDDNYYYYFHQQIDALLNPEKYFYSWKNLDTSDASTFIEKYYKYSMPFLIPLKQADFATRGDSTFKKCDLIIRKGGNIIETVDIFNPIGEFVKKEAGKNINIEVNNDLVLQYWHVSDSPDTKPWLFIDSVDSYKYRGILLNFKILNNGKWTALVEVEIWAQRDFPQSNKGVVYEANATTAAHMIFIFKVDSDGNKEELYRYGKFFPLLCYVDTLYIESEGTYTSYIALRNQILTIPNKGFPSRHAIKDDSIIRASDPNSVAIIIHVIFGWNSRYAPNAPDYDKTILEVADEFYFPVQDSYQAKVTNGGDIDSWQLDSVYASGKELFDAGAIVGTDAHKWNMSLATLKGGDFLFGIHDDALYKIGSSSTLEIVGGGLKNFRLRELKRISTAKK